MRGMLHFQLAFGPGEILTHLCLATLYGALSGRGSSIRRCWSHMMMRANAKKTSFACSISWPGPFLQAFYEHSSTDIICTEEVFRLHSSLHRSKLEEGEGRPAFLKAGFTLLIKITSSSTCHPAFYLELALLHQRLNRLFY